MDRLRSVKYVIEFKYRLRFRSVDFENWNWGVNKEEEVLWVKRKDFGFYVVLNRIEVWVELVVKMVLVGKIFLKNKILVGILWRFKIFNFFDMD